jgi:Response regulator of the LytR/AlgR family
MISVSQLGFHKVYYKVIHDEVGMEQVTFTFVEGEATLQTEEIFYIETSRHKNIFHTADKTYSIYRKMDEIEAVMEGMGFCRCHQSFLVNMRYIQKISSYVMTLTTGQELSVPKARYREVKRQYAEYLEKNGDSAAPVCS